MARPGSRPRRHAAPHPVVAPIGQRRDGERSVQASLEQHEQAAVLRVGARTLAPTAGDHEPSMSRLGVHVAERVTQVLE